MKELLRFLLDNKMIDKEQYDNWLKIDIKTRYELLTLAQNDIENALDDNCNVRELTDIEKRENEDYLKHHRNLLDIEVFKIIKEEI